MNIVAEICGYHYHSIKDYNSLQKQEKKLKKLMQQALTYEEWKHYAEQYDNLKHKKMWKRQVESDLYDYKYIQQLRNTLRIARQQRNVHKVMTIIRQNLSRNIGNILNPELYRECYVGTKQLIEDFQDEMENCVQFIEEVSNDVLPIQAKLEFFIEAKHTLGRTALLCSGGGLMGMFHSGVFKALHDQNLLPRIISGTSAGSIISSFIATQKDIQRFQQRGQTNWKSFQMHNITFGKKCWTRLKRFLTKGLMLDINHVANFVKDNIGDITFQEAYDSTGFILNITVKGKTKHIQDRLLNYLTAPNVVVWSAVACSCSIPFVYGSFELLCKNQKGQIVPYIDIGSQFVDGSLYADLPKEKIGQMFNVNNFIVSQTNAYVIPFLDKSEQFRRSNAFLYHLFQFFDYVKNFVYDEFRHRIQQLSNLGIFSHGFSMLAGVVLQEYQGNVTIVPTPIFDDYLRILEVITDDEQMDHFLEYGQKAAFSKIPVIDAQTRFEIALEVSYKNIRESLIQDMQQVSINQIDDKQKDDEGNENIWEEDIDQIEDLRKGTIIIQGEPKKLFERQKYASIQLWAPGQNQSDVLEKIKNLGAQEVKIVQPKRNKWSLNFA